MTDLTVSSTDTAKAATLASLGNNLSAGSSINSIFDRILSDFRSTATTQKNTLSSITSAPTLKTSPTRDSSNLAARVSNLAASLSRASSALHNSLGNVSARNNQSAPITTDKGKTQPKSGNSSTQAKPDAKPAPVADTAPSQVSDTNTQPAVLDVPTSNQANTSPQAQASDTTSNTAPNTVADNTDQDPSLTDLVTQLQDFLQTLRGTTDIQNANTASPSSGSALPSDQVEASNSPSAAGGNDPALQDMEMMLSELLRLAKDAQKLNADTTTTQQNVDKTAPQTTMATAAAPQVVADPTQSAAAKPQSFDLNKFIKDLQAAVDTQTTQTDSQAQPSVVQDKGQAEQATPSTLVVGDDTHKPTETARNLPDLVAATANTNTAPQPTSSVSTANVQTDARTFGANENTSDTPFESHQGNTGANGTANNGFLINSLNTSADGTKTVSSYSFASQLTNVHNANNAALLTAVDQVRLQLGRGAKSGTDQMTLQLQPAELGRINIKLTFAEDGSVKGTVLASNASTLDMLTKDSRNLERALQDAGLRADAGSLQFGMTGQRNNNSGAFADKSKNSGGSAADDIATDVADVNTETSAETWLLTPGRVNLKV
jgi:hypothetical protein